MRKRDSSPVVVLRSLGLASLLVLAACGGGGAGGNPGVTPDAGANGSGSDSAPGNSGAGNLVSQLSANAWGNWLDQGITYNDADGDGIQDSFDAWPQEMPELADPTALHSPTVAATWSVVDGRTVADTVVENYPLHLRLDGLDAGGQRVWIVFETAAGLRASPAGTTDGVEFTAEPYPDASGVHVVVGSTRGISRAIESVRSGEPLFFTPQAALGAGTTVVLEGRNLDRVESVRLGDSVIQIGGATSNAMTFELPSAPGGNTLIAKSISALSNSVLLDIRQTVTLRVSNDLALPQDEALRFWTAGGERRLSHTAPVVLELPAWRPALMSFDIVRGDTVRSYNSIYVIVWPGETQVDVSAPTSLLAQLMNSRDYLPDLRGTDWAAIRIAVERALATTAGQDYLVALAEHAAGRRAAPEEALLAAVGSSYIAMAQQVAANERKSGSAAAAAPTTTLGGDLDGIVVSAIIGYEVETKKDDPAVDEQPNVLYPEGDQVFGNDYSLIAVLRHQDPQLFTPSGSILATCEFSTEENRWFNLRQGSTSEYDRVWRSDLCLQIGGATFVSAAVAKPGFGSASAIFNAAAAGSSPPGLLRRHSRAKFADFDYQLGRGGTYLRSDSGQPLCHNETCYIELITSGYGAELTISLTSEQQALVDTLRVRMWVEGLLPWMFKLPGLIEDTEPDAGSTDDTPVSTEFKKRVFDCLRNDLLKNNQLYIAFETLREWMDENGAKTGDVAVLALYDAVDQTIWPWFKDYVLNKAGPVFDACFENIKPADEIQGAITSKVLSVTGLSKFLDVLAFVADVGSAVTTPEKFVFKVQPRAEIKKVSPQGIDLKDESSSLTIDGDWLYITDANAATPCSGEGYCPSLVFTDPKNAARVREYPLGPQHFTASPAGCGYACARISVPFSEFLADPQNSLQDLLSGRLRVELTLADPDYSSYPDGKLRIPVPGQTLAFKAQPKLYAIDPPLANPGQTVTISGDGFDAFGTSAVFEMVDQVNSNPTKQMRRAEDSPDTDTAVRLIVPATGGSNYRIVVRAGTDAPDTSIAPLTSETQLLVTSGSFPLIIVGDHGVDKDDKMVVEIFDAQDRIVEVLAPNPINNSGLYWQIPDFAGNYVDGRSWDESTDANGDPLYLSAEPVKVRVNCEDGGIDRYCSFGIRSLKDLLCVSANRAPRPAWANQVFEAEANPFRDYWLAPNIDDIPCSDVVP